MLIPIKNHNPDILECLADLSNDEVMTPPSVADKMLNLLPAELFSNPNTKFLDLATKSGVFLKKIVEKCNEGLKDIIVDDEERVTHILKEMVYGISITELTGMIARRTIYCAKDAMSEDSIITMDSPDGNVRYQPSSHNFNKNSKCTLCGISKSNLYNNTNDENYAYSQIHDKDLIEELKNMKFDVIIGNPPYQLSDGGGGKGSSAKPLYHIFVEQAIVLNPKYLVMIIPARWFAGGKGLDAFRDKMLNDTHIKSLDYFVNEKECFPNNEIKGGVCYFLWDKNYSGTCKMTTHEDGKILSVSNKVLKSGGLDIVLRHSWLDDVLYKIDLTKNFSELVHPSKPFGIRSNFSGYHITKKRNSLKLYRFGENAYVFKNQIKNHEMIDKYKIFLPKATGSGNPKFDRLKPFIGDKNTVSTETYLMIGPFESKEIAENVLSYINTKFFHILLLQKKITQNTSQDSFSLIPIVDFKKKWTDKKLYKKFKLTEEEIKLIESTVWPE